MQVARALGLNQFSPQAVQGFAGLSRRTDLILFRLPAAAHLRRLDLKPRQLFLQLDQTRDRAGVGFLLQGLALDFQLHKAAVDLIQLFRLRIDGHAHAATRLVDQVDGLVRQETVGDIAVGQGRRCHDGRVGDPHPVVQLVLFLQAAQDRHRILHGRLGDEDRLETAGQGGILFHMLAIFIQRRGPDTVQLAARQGGLQQVGGVHRPLGLARPDQGVHLVDEQDDLALGGGGLVQDRLQTLFKFAAKLCARDQGAHVQRHQLLVLQAFGHVAIDDAQR